MGPAALGEKSCGRLRLRANWLVQNVPLTHSLYQLNEAGTHACTACHTLCQVLQAYVSLYGVPARAYAS